MLFKLLTVLVAAACFLVQQSVANPIAQDEPLTNYTGSDVGSMHWYGEIFPGKGMVKLVGHDVQDIEDQIVKLNPMFMAKSAAVGQAKFNPNAHIPVLYCGHFSTGDGNTGTSMIQPFKPSFHDMTVTPPRKCIRHSCKDTTGIYICNDSDDHTILMYKNYLFDFTRVILNKCCSFGFYRIAPISGQAFLDLDKMNVVLSYANCNLAPDAMNPSDFQFPGPNQECCKECRTDKYGRPYLGGWGHDGL